jgi:hypothetical protein
VRAGKWKLHLPRPADPPWTPRWARHIKPRDVIAIESPLLFDLEADVGEQRDVAAQHPDVVARLLKRAEHARQDIGDYNRVGRHARFFDPGPRRPDIARRRRRKATR